MGLWNKKAPRPKEFTLFYVADIHGSEKCFRKFINAARFYGVDALILGGDITGKALVPLVERADGRIEVHFLGEDRVLNDEADVEEAEKAIRSNGFYPFRITEQALSDLASDDAQRQKEFDRIMADELRRWVRLSDERLDGLTTDCLVMPGNDDEHFTGPVLDEADRLINPENKIVRIGPYQVLSLGYSNQTPWHSPRELSEDELTRRLDELAAQLDPAVPSIFNIHVPPYGTALDDAPELRADLSIVGGSNSRMVPVGSPAVRAAIETYHPVLSLHGHIHESRGTAKVGKTVAINPGSEYNTGVLRGVIVRLRGSEVVGAQFVGA
jgi:uncharacterized protein